MDLISDHALLYFDFVLRKGRRCCKFKQKGCCLPQVFLQYGGMEDDLLLSGVCVKLSAKLVQITVYGRSLSLCRALEYCMLEKMRDAAVESGLIASSSLDAQGAVAHS